MSLEALLPILLPKAIAWGEEKAKDVIARGRELLPAELLIARRVGVQYPERIRLLLTKQIPFPEDPQLAEVARRLGLFFTEMNGLTLGYAIIVRQGCLSSRLLSHECRHVYQYEQAGGIANFLKEYLQSVVQFGYYNSPFEQDARAHEIEWIGP
ncbi:hypothetical protein [Methylacidiphilum caldifontis]|uniref:DUF4157 domain-containing protein n=1 Tax=Methylacidiphilum caldifontis TaxID=2795386 RepID=A0A4Y8PIM4_9BACT|nr:hypothetical protein [Methylacidiphilum caldifontis]TFE72957.1 hypothetical protein A7Q10_03600 [Methylacidiphilum caldifontis]